MYCPRCHTTMARATAYSGTPSKFWLSCPRCNTYVNTYKPQPHQEAVHKDPHLYIGNFGGYGTGKTLTSMQEVYKHIFITPNANVLISADIAAQYEQTIKRDIESDIPKEFIADVNNRYSYMDFINGARILFRPLYDVDNLRSLNLSMFVIVEASEVSPEAFTQLKTRTRNLAASVPEFDEHGNIVYDKMDNGALVPRIKYEWRRGIIESNPDSGWIRTDILYYSDKVCRHGRAMDDFAIPESSKDPAIASHVASTDVNAFLPPNFIAEQTKNKPMWWINRYILSSFNYAEGLVYPTARDSIVETFKIPRGWRRIVAADYGLSDDFVYLLGAIDEKEGVLYIYKEVRTKNRNIEELAKLYFDNTKDIPMGGLYCSPILDPKSGAKRDYNKKTLYDHFLDYGISFIPGHVSVDARVFRTNTYLESGKLKIMDCCEGLIEEITNYKFPDKKLGVYTPGQDKPIDKNNHAINPLEWICMALPADPKKLLLGSYDGFGNKLEDEDTRYAKAHNTSVWQFADTEEREESMYIL